MTQVHIDGSDVVVNVRGWHKVLAFKSEIRIPLAHVEGVARAGDELREWKGWRVPGTALPGFYAGTFYANDGPAFWDVAGGDKAIAIYLRDDYFTKLVVDVEDPDATIRVILRAAATPRELAGCTHRHTLICLRAALAGSASGRRYR